MVLRRNTGAAVLSGGQLFSLRRILGLRSLHITASADVAGNSARVFGPRPFALRWLCLRGERFRGMVQKHPFSGNTRDLSADPDRSRVGAGLRESLAAVLGLQFRE